MKINPLNVLNLREVNVPLSHFEFTTLTVTQFTAAKIKEWIYSNLNNRFYFGGTLVLENNQIVIKLKIGFEEPKEASFFLLACPDLKI